jgi:acetyl esterase
MPEINRFKTEGEAEIKITACLLLSGILAFLAVGAKKAPRPGWGEFSPADAEYIYRETAGEPQKLVVYYPDGWSDGKKYPCVLLFHGGGWAGGDLSYFQYYCEYFASRGLVAITANYKLCKKTDWPDLPPGTSKKRWGVKDAKSCIRWVKANAEKLGIDPEKMVLGGGSTGGHIATLALLDEEFSHADDPDIDTDVAALMLFNPAYTRVKEGAVQDVNVFKKLNPVLPPAIVFYGSEDGWKGTFNQLVPLLKEQETVFETWIAPGQKHGFFNYIPWCDVVLAQADAFLVFQGIITGKSSLEPPVTGEKLVKVNEK